MLICYSKNQVLRHLKTYGATRFVAFADERHDLTPNEAKPHSQMVAIYQEGQESTAHMIGKEIQRNVPTLSVEINWNGFSDYEHLL